jgi:lysophospholipase L1-like esterase
MHQNHTQGKLVYGNDAIVTLSAEALAGPIFCLRSGLRNSAGKFLREKAGRVAFLGGSITQMQGWSHLTEAHLRERFPEAKLEFINAAIGGTNSTFGVFRFDEHVLAKGAIDLLFLEFAVNDGSEVKLGNQRLQAMEGIIRKARLANPAVDILVLYLEDETKVQAYRQHKEPVVITHHERVMVHYNIPVLNLALEMTRRLDAGQFVWSDFSRDSCHPKPFGHEQYLGCIRDCLDIAWAGASAAVLSSDYPVPPPLCADHLTNARLVPPTEAKGWRMVYGWVTEKVCNYNNPVDVLTAEAPGDALELEFDGSLLAISTIAGMDAGALEIIIDGVELPVYDLFDNYCKQFHRPVFHVLAHSLPEGKHTAQLRVAGVRHADSTGHAVRILNFAVA